VVSQLVLTRDVGTTTNKVIAEALPDFGVTVVGPSGRRLATRQLVQLNAPGD
jgi:hypothetical protein